MYVHKSVVVVRFLLVALFEGAVVSILSNYITIDHRDRRL